MKLSHFASAIALTLGALTHVHAAPLVLGDQVNVDDKSGGVFTSSSHTNGLHDDLKIKLDNSRRDQNVEAGLFVLDYKHASTNWTQFLSFCLEPDVNLQSFDNPYTVKSIAGAGYAVGAYISELWGRYFDLINDDTKAAAFQVALWELAYGNTDKQLGSGDFQVVSNDSVKNLAQTWLNSLNGKGPMAAGLVVLVDEANGKERQDLITQGPVNDVPEPAMLALLGIGLAGIGMSRRRRTTAPSA